jgi:tetratricopeptide (TPR) repeat protein
MIQTVFKICIVLLAVIPFDASQYAPPQDLQYLWQRGIKRMSDGQLDEAIADFTKATRLDPNSPTAYHYRADAYIKKRDHSSAIKDLTRAIGLGQNSAFYDRGLSYVSIDEYDKAIADLTKAVEFDKDDPRPYYYRAYALRKKGEYTKAIADYSEAITIFPQHAYSYAERGFAYNEKGDYDKAIADLTKALEIEPKRSVFYTTRGIAFQNKGEYNRAIEDHDIALLLDPTNPIAYRNRGAAYLLKEDYEKAERDLRAAIRLDPGLDYANRDLAWLLAGCPDERRRNGKEAVRLAKRACELTEWKNAASLGVLGLALAETRDFQEAIKSCSKALHFASEEEKSQLLIDIELYRQGKLRRIPDYRGP